MWRRGEVFDRCNAMADALVREWLRGEVPMKPGLLQLLAYLQRTGRIMAVVSSTEQDLVKDLLRRAGILHYFSAVVCGDMVRHSKPAPDIYLLGAQRVGVPSEQCLVLEDSENGARAGIAARVPGRWWCRILPRWHSRCWTPRLRWCPASAA